MMPVRRSPAVRVGTFRDIRNHRSRIALLGLLIAANCAALPPAARASTDQEKPPKPSNDAPKPKHFLGDWGGVRPKLKRKGVNISVTYTGEAAANVSGGLRRGLDYAQQLEFKADLDWSKLAGLTGFSSHLIGVHRSGRNASTDYVGDGLFQSQSIYGGTQNSILHLVQFYGEQKFAGGEVDLAAGRLPVGEDFATSPLYCAFMNTALCGYPHSLPAKVGFTVYPNSTWGARLRVKAGANVYVQAGAYQVRPAFGGRYGLDWGFSGTTGVYFPAELGWEPSFGSNNLPGHYKIGVAIDTSDYDDNTVDARGMPFVLTGAPPLRRGSRHSFYLLGDQMLRRNGKGGTAGLIALAGYVHSAPRTSQLSDYAFAALVDNGFWTARANDSIGVSIAYAKISNSLRRTQLLQASTGLPLADGAPAPQTDEVVLEARYSIGVAPGLDLMPDVQYLVRPSATDRIPNALVVGVRTTISL